MSFQLSVSVAGYYKLHAETKCKDTTFNAKEIEDSIHTFLVYLTFEQKQVIHLIPHTRSCLISINYMRFPNA